MTDILKKLAKHFDTAYYCREYADVGESIAFEHFMKKGWIEGRNPSPYFDTLSYLANNSDVAISNTNPLLHYVLHGEKEGRKTYPATSPQSRLKIFYQIEKFDWLALLFKIIDFEYYEQQTPHLKNLDIDILTHFWLRGWRENINPNSEISIQRLSLLNPTLTTLNINPIVILDPVAAKIIEGIDLKVGGAEHIEPTRVSIETEAGEQCADSRRHANSSASCNGAQELYADKIEAIRPYFDEAYYLQQFDAYSETLNPITHFFMIGAYEAKNPSNEFDCAYYLGANPDVKAAGINPFWHYVVAGKSEGRLGKEFRTTERLLIANATRYKPPSLSPRKNDLAKDLMSIVAKLAKNATGCVISLSHDSYTENTGGLQLFVGDEEAVYRNKNYLYFHVAPFSPDMSFAKTSEGAFYHVTLNGMKIGAVTDRQILKSLNEISKPIKKLLVIHSILGHNLKFLKDIIYHFRPAERAFWAHDFSILCENFNLLRNDYTYCNAPAPFSNACMICAQGESRKAHLENVKELFQDNDFYIMTPSENTKSILLAKLDISFKQIISIPHIMLNFSTPRRRAPPKAARAKVRALKVAFIGHPNTNKGWHLFKEIVSETDHTQIQYFHFSTSKSANYPQVKPVQVKVSSSDRMLMVKSLQENQIDVVIILSIWPETFSYVTVEAILAGCNVFCLKGSGNVAALVETHQAGRVFNSHDEIISLLSSDDWTIFQRRQVEAIDGKYAFSHCSADCENFQ